MHPVTRNINTIQHLVLEELNDFLKLKGYKLINKEQKNEYQSLLIQWSNSDKNHTFQITWDSKDRWFYLDEFNRLDNLDYRLASNIDFFPFKTLGVLFRNNYHSKYIEKIKIKITEKLE